MRVIKLWLPLVSVFIQAVRSLITTTLSFVVFLIGLIGQSMTRGLL